MSLVQKTSLAAEGFSREKKELIKSMHMPDATDTEFSWFLEVCSQTGLNPFANQIFPVSRYDAKKKKNVWTFQTSIDGYRLIAERTKKYCPGRETNYTYDKEGTLLSATAYVKKLTSDGTWHEVSATAFWAEYVQTYIPKDESGSRKGAPQIMGLWSTKPHIMLAKCAEALALRKAFPNDLSGLYVEEEMQKEVVDVMPNKIDTSQMLDSSQALVLSQLLEGCDDYKSKIFAHYSDKLGRSIENVAQLPASEYDLILTRSKAYVMKSEKPQIEEAAGE